MIDFGLYMSRNRTCKQGGYSISNLSECRIKSPFELEAITPALQMAG